MVVATGIEMAVVGWWERRQEGIKCRSSGEQTGQVDRRPRVRCTASTGNALAGSRPLNIRGFHRP